MDYQSPHQDYSTRRNRAITVGSAGSHVDDKSALSHKIDKLQEQRELSQPSQQRQQNQRSTTPTIDPRCNCEPDSKPDARSQLTSMRKKIMSSRRHTVAISRPVVPHLHLVNLRPQEKLINKVLFNDVDGNGNSSTSKTP